MSVLGAAIPPATQELLSGTLSELLGRHAPGATLLGLLGDRVWRISADAPPQLWRGNELSPPDEWLSDGVLHWLSCEGTLLGLLWSAEALSAGSVSLLQLLLQAAQPQQAAKESGLLLSQLPAPVAWLDQELRFRQVSRHFLELHGLRRDEVIGRGVGEVFPARTLLPALLRRALAGQPTELPAEPLNATRPDSDAPLWLRGEARPYLDTRGAGVLWISQDVSHERELALRLDTLLDDADTMLALLDPGGQVQNASLALLTFNAGLQGQSSPGQGALLGRPFWEWPCWPPGSATEVEALVRQAATGTPATLDLTLAGGVSFQLSLRPATTGSGLLLAECRDLTAQHELEARAALGSQMLSEVLARSQEATVMIDPAGRVSLVNEEAASLLGLETVRLLGASPVKLLQEAGVQLLTPDGATRLDYRRWTRQTMPPEQEVMLVNPAGTRRILQVRLRLLPALPGQRPAAVLTLRDVSKLRRVEARLQHDHHHDSLTGLLNRSGLLARLGSLMAGGQGAVIALDIGGFPALTAALGRTASDALLVQLAARLSVWRQGALAARLGENVFALGLPASPREGLEADLQELRRALRQPLRAGGRDVPLSFNLGGMEAGAGANPDGLIGGAETALGYLGREGRGLETVYQESMRSEVARSFVLESELPGALRRGELRLSYQPIVGLGGGAGTGAGAMIGAEALLRWAHPTLGVLPPSSFLPLASRSPLIGEIGEWVVREAVAARAAWEPGTRVSVNLSLDELLRQDELERLFPLMETQGAPDFELTASNLPHYSERSLELLERLRERGARIWVDDFGEGPGSLSLLERLPISGVKLHPSFVARLPQPRAVQLLRGTTALASGLGLMVTAVGVETAEQLGVLGEAGVTAAQGYLFAPPMSGAELAGWQLPSWPS